MSPTRLGLLATAVLCGACGRSPKPVEKAEVAATTSFFPDSDSDANMAADSLVLSNHRLRVLGFLLWKEDRKTGHVPDSIASVLPAGSRASRDPWNQAVEMTVWRDSILLVSRGPDRTLGTLDDIRILVLRLDSLVMWDRVSH
jgi:hypothetical protein